MAAQKKAKPRIRGGQGKQQTKASRRFLRAAPKPVLIFAAVSLSCVVLALGIALTLGGLGGEVPQPPQSQVAAADAAAPTNEPRSVARQGQRDSAQPEGSAAAPGATAKAKPDAAPTNEPRSAARQGQRDSAQPEGSAAAPGAAAKAAPSRPRQSTAAPSRPDPKVSRLAAQGPSNSSSIRPRTIPHKGTLVFVIDDGGYSMKDLKPFLDLPFPLTIAVLPSLPLSEEAARAVRAAGKELIMHQPMESLGGNDPGPGAIMRGMSGEKVRSLIETNLKTVPGAVGMNNHMGSAVTTDQAIMDAVAAIAKKRDIYYLDSRTVSETATSTAALKEGISYWERDVFLDNTSSREYIVKAVEDGKKRAGKGYPAIMIGHVWSAELAQTLADLYPRLIAEGYSLSTISRYMIDSLDDGDAGSRH